MIELSLMERKWCEFTSEITVTSSQVNFFQLAQIQFTENLDGNSRPMANKIMGKSFLFNRLDEQFA